MSDREDRTPRKGLNVDRLAAALDTARGRGEPRATPVKPAPQASKVTVAPTSEPEQTAPLQLGPEMSASLPPLILKQPLNPSDVPAPPNDHADNQSGPIRSLGLFDRQGRLARSLGQNRSSPIGAVEADNDLARHPSEPMAVQMPEVPSEAVTTAASVASPNGSREDVMRRSAAELRPASLTAVGPTLLALSGIKTDIGRYHILDGVDLEVPSGGVTMLLGRNGAGKTTTLRTIMGLWRARAGRITFGDDDMTNWPTPRIARAGIGYVPEDMGVFAKLTVAENMSLGVVSGTPSRDRLDWILTAFPPLKTFWKLPAGHLSGGQKQMLSIARAMVVQRRLYLIDEPSKGLAPAIVATLAGALRDLKSQGASILMVEQNFGVARALGDTCAVMEDGHCVWAGTMAELTQDAALQDRLLGLRAATGDGL